MTARFALLLLLLPFASALAGEEVKTFPNDPAVTVDRAGKEVRIEAEMSSAMTTVTNLVEFLIESGTEDPETKKWRFERGYESVFLTRAKPSTLHLALLYAGFRPGAIAPPARPDQVKDNAERAVSKPEAPAETAPAPRIDIFVEWLEDGKPVRARAEDFLFDRGRKARAEPTPWAFTGSYLMTNDKGEKALAAEQTRILAGVFHDASALLNLPQYTDNPYRGATAGLELRADTLPEHFRQQKEIVEGTNHVMIWLPKPDKVTLILLPAAEPAAPAAP